MQPVGKTSSTYCKRWRRWINTAQSNVTLFTTGDVPFLSQQLGEDSWLDIWLNLQGFCIQTFSNYWISKCRQWTWTYLRCQNELNLTVDAWILKKKQILYLVLWKDGTYMCFRWTSMLCVIFSSNRLCPGTCVRVFWMIGKILRATLTCSMGAVLWEKHINQQVSQEIKHP